jgi:hypothetical protein
MKKLVNDGTSIRISSLDSTYQCTSIAYQVVARTERLQFCTVKDGQKDKKIKNKCEYRVHSIGVDRCLYQTDTRNNLKTK